MAFEAVFESVIRLNQSAVHFHEERDAAEAQIFDGQHSCRVGVAAEDNAIPVFFEKGKNVRIDGELSRKQPLFKKYASEILVVLMEPFSRPVRDVFRPCGEGYGQINGTAQRIEKVHPIGRGAICCKENLHEILLFRIHPGNHIICFSRKRLILKFPVVLKRSQPN